MCAKLGHTSYSKMENSISSVFVEIISVDIRQPQCYIIGTGTIGTVLKQF